MIPACADNAHRPLGTQHNLSAILSEVEQRVITDDYTFRHDNRILQILRQISDRACGAPRCGLRCGAMAKSPRGSKIAMSS